MLLGLVSDGDSGPLRIHPALEGVIEETSSYNSNYSSRDTSTRSSKDRAAAGSEHGGGSAGDGASEGQATGAVLNADFFPGKSHTLYICQEVS